MSTMSAVATGPRFLVVLQVEAFKLRRSLALLLAGVAPSLVVAFLFFNLLRLEKAAPWPMALQGSAAIWAFFMLPMSVTALTALPTPNTRRAAGSTCVPCRCRPGSCTPPSCCAC
jgi:ABC-2 type transport system permease protein